MSQQVSLAMRILLDENENKSEIVYNTDESKSLTIVILSLPIFLPHQIYVASAKIRLEAVQQFLPTCLKFL